MYMYVYIYIYIYIYTCIYAYTYIYIYICIERERCVIMIVIITLYQKVASALARREARLLEQLLLGLADDVQDAGLALMVV